MKSWNATLTRLGIQPYTAGKHIKYAASVPVAVELIEAAFTSRRDVVARQEALKVFKALGLVNSGGNATGKEHPVLEDFSVDAVIDLGNPEAAQARAKAQREKQKAADKVRKEAAAKALAEARVEQVRAVAERKGITEKEAAEWLAAELGDDRYKPQTRPRDVPKTEVTAGEEEKRWEGAERAQEKHKVAWLENLPQAYEEEFGDDDLRHITVKKGTKVKIGGDEFDVDDGPILITPEYVG